MQHNFRNEQNQIRCISIDQSKHTKWKETNGCKIEEVHQNYSSRCYLQIFHIYYRCTLKEKKNRKKEMRSESVPIHTSTQKKETIGCTMIETNEWIII
jgi:hypothetical protein